MSSRRFRSGAERVQSAADLRADDPRRRKEADEFRALATFARRSVCVRRPGARPTAFVPCKDGISHSPSEDANPADAALAAEIILTVIRSLQ